STAYRSFPTLIILTTTWQRAELWRRAHLSAQDRMGVVDPLLAVITVATPIVASSGRRQLNPWLQLSWRTLATGEPCPLEQALRPRDQHTLPPDLLAHLHDVQALQHHAQQAHDLSHQQTAPLMDEQPSCRRVVQGAFMARARHVALMKTASTPAELLASFSLVFGQRYLDMLTLLYQAPLLTSDELAAVTGLHSSSVLRYVRELQRFGCVQSWPDRIVREIRWSVAERGLRLLAAAHHLHVLRLSTTTAAGHSQSSSERALQMAHGSALMPKGLELIKRQLNHTKGIYHFLVLLHQQLRTVHGRMDWWIIAGQCERSFRQSGRIYHVRPDAEFQLTLADGRQIRAWLEWDTGTMQQTGLTRKLQAYARYARSREWVREGLPNLPLLLFVVPEKSQEEKVCRLLREVGLPAGLRARTTTRTRLDRGGGALDAIWRNPYQEEGQERSVLLPTVRVSG
ncbi:MAG TPA: replication-relaxation family protein, partial [Ktedonobacteraceae bacterium]|nr:replication-relaxation family protein [Ktedonobacteraceae bacterium]